MRCPLTGGKGGCTMKELQYSNAVYDNVAAASYVQYNQSASETNMVGNLRKLLQNVTLFLHRASMSSVPTQQSMQLWIRLFLG